MEEIQLNDGTSVKIEQIKRAVYYGVDTSAGYGPIENGKINFFKNETPSLLIYVKGGKERGAIGDVEKLKSFLEEQDIRVDIGS